MHADAGETRFFVSTAGTLLEAELVAVAVETITLRKKEDGRELTVAKATLCKEDHAYIEAWAAQNPDQTSATVAPAASTSAGAGGKKFSLMSTIRGSKSNRGDAYFRTVVLSYAVTL
ncbi:MAG: hypothetical protein JNG86_04915, partial [Verrucomicrobiaceae bacterium]|nr:hypothetical protein [Verrucomicrobiaceae bacterium]